MRPKIWVTGLVLFVLTAVTLLLATTWTSSEISCPVCHTKNKFNVVMSYGTYIYGWPSKFQFVYWPFTDGNSLYSCKECHYSAFMGDFEKLPAAKVDDVRQAVRDVSLEQRESYTEVSMAQRLEAAEKVYSGLGKDEEFWCHFYRVKAYHLAREKRSVEAAAARVKALELVRRLIDDPKQAGQRKELFLISAAMHHFLQDDVAAQSDLERSVAARFEKADYSADQNKNANENLTALAKEYIDLVVKHKVPSDDGSERE